MSTLQLPGVPGQAVAHIGVSVPERNGDNATVFLWPNGEAEDNDINKRSACILGVVRKSTCGSKRVFLNGGGYFDLDYGRYSRKRIALCIASRLAGLSIAYTNGRAEVQ